MRTGDCGLEVHSPTEPVIGSLQTEIRKPKSAISRRDFLAGIGVVLLPAAADFSFAPESLYVLKPNDLERLKLDFNSNLNRVRLLFVLSPT